MNVSSRRYSEVEVDQIYHLACPASPVHYKHNPVKTIKTSVMGTLNMLGLAKRIGARFLLTSTSEVYGDPLQHPQKEEYWRGGQSSLSSTPCLSSTRARDTRVLARLHLDAARSEANGGVALARSAIGCDIWMRNKHASRGFLTFAAAAALCE